MIDVAGWGVTYRRMCAFRRVAPTESGVRLRFRVIPSCDCTATSMAVWSTATVSVGDDVDDSDGDGMGKLGAGWPRIRWAKWRNDEVRRGLVCISAVFSFP